MRRVLPILTLALLAQTANADLVRVSSERVLRVRGWDGVGAEAFKAELVRTDAGYWEKIHDGFGFVGSNFVAGSTTQRSNMDPVVTPEPPNSLMLFQGSAALVGSISNANPFSAESVSSVSYTFSTDVLAKVRIIWSLESRGRADSRAAVGPSSFSLRDEGAAPGETLLFEEAGVGQINTGFITLDLAPGVYTLDAGAFATMFQGEGSVLPASPEQSGGYTVTIALLPSPASVVPLAMGGVLLSRRRR